MKRILLISLILIISSCAMEVGKLKKDEEKVKTVPSFSGKFLGFEYNNRTNAWLGIPYAEPPVGSLRWKAPRTIRQNKEKIRALEFGNPCPQEPSVSIDRKSNGTYVGAEDCLFLNVFSPISASSNDNLPVMFWIHGGGNTSGEAGSYDFSKLSAEHNLIIVSVNYRLGFLGWFYHPVLASTSDSLEDRSGNFGTLDQILALKWVRQNIKDFGGNPNNVTIFGESAGGKNVFALLSSPLAKGLFHKAISQSGATNTVTHEDASKFFDGKESSYGASSREAVSNLLVLSKLSKDEFEADIAQESMNEFKLLDLIQSIDLNQIFKAYKNITKQNESGLGTIPRVFSDGHVIPKRGMKFSSKSFYNDVPVIFGTNRDETKLFLAMNSDYSTNLLNRLVIVRNQEMYDLEAEYGSNNWKISAVDNPARDMLSSGKTNVFAYRFDWDEQGKIAWMDLSKVFGAAHAMEIPFITGTMKLLGIERFMFNDENLPDAIRLSIAMQSYWAEFAHTGNPGKGRDKNLPTWGNWTLNGDKFIIFDTKNDQGIKMSREELFRLDEFKRLYSDTRIKRESDRCKFLKDLRENADEKAAIEFYESKCL